MTWQQLRSAIIGARKAILGTLGAAGVWLAAMIAVQPSVDTSPLPLARLGATEWVTTAAFTDTVDGVTIIIPPSFHTDLASIGVFEKLLGIKRDDPVIKRAALSHDFGYSTHYTNKEAIDWRLYRTCIEDGMNKEKAEAVLKAVELYGFIPWNKH